MNQTFKLLFLFILIFASVTIEAQYQTGNYNITFQDPNRSNRNIETEIYYPATYQGEHSTVAIGQFPVIVFGHGLLIPWSDYQILWEQLVPKGYIMVIPKTESGLLSTDHQEFGWDLQFLVTKIQDEGGNYLSPIYNAVLNNTALMGHSMGGGALFLAADSLCNNENEQLKTIVAMAPAESFSNGVSSIASAVNISVPSLIFSGSQDGVTPPSEHHIPIYDNLSSECKTLISISGGAHCYFANSNLACDLVESLSSNGISISREEQQAITFDFLDLWLDYTLKDSCNNFSVFQDSLSSSTSIAYEQICYQNPTADILFNDGMLSSSVIGLDYQWYLNGAIIPQANEISYLPTQDGEYTLEVFFPSGCSTLSDTYNLNMQWSGNPGRIPVDYKLHQNFPNPFNPITSLFYEVPKDDLVSITIYDIMGKVVKNLVNSYQIAGYHSVKWHATNNRNESVPAGIYLCKIKIGKFTKTQKMALLK